MARRPEGAHSNGWHSDFQPGETYAGGGMWMAEKPTLDAFRKAIVRLPRLRGKAALEPLAVRQGVEQANERHHELKRVPPWPAGGPS